MEKGKGICVGLFGTCSDDAKKFGLDINDPRVRWRDPVIKTLCEKHDFILHDNWGVDLTPEYREALVEYKHPDAIPYPDTNVNTVFDPDKGENWQESDYWVEHRIFKGCDLAVFDINETSIGDGSLGEFGLSLKRAREINPYRPFVVKIDPTVCKEVEEQSPDKAAVSNRLRKFVKGQLELLNDDFVSVVNTSEELSEAVEYWVDYLKIKRELEDKMAQLEEARTKTLGKFTPKAIREEKLAGSPADMARMTSLGGRILNGRTAEFVDPKKSII